MGSRINKSDLQAECAAKGLPIDGSLKEIKDRLKKHQEEVDITLFNRVSRLSKSINPDHFRLAPDKFLIQVKLDNTAMYFVHGLIYPLNFEESKVYREQNRKYDYFNDNPNSILLAKGVVNDFIESDVLLEVVLKANEIAELEKVDEVALLGAPLPISRVTAIYFANDSAKKSFLASIDIFPDAFVPEGLCYIIPEGIETVLFSGKTVNVSAKRDWKLILERFDRLMGLIAYVRNTAAFYASTTNEYIDYTPGYFNLLSLINSYDGGSSKENAFFRWIIHPENIDIDNKLARYQFREILKAVYSGIEFDIDWALKLIEESVAFEKQTESSEQSKSIFKLLLDYKKLKNDYRTLLAHPLISGNIPITILIFLVKFPSKSLGHSDKQALKNYFRSRDCVLERSTAESVFAVLGLYYGYKNLVKEDKIEIADPFFSRLAMENSQIKFRLDSFLDRFTVESIFEFCKRGFERLVESFEFLKHQTKKVPSELLVPRGLRDEYIDQSFIKFEKLIINIRKVNIGLVVAKEIMSIYSNGITREEYLYTYIEKYLPELLIVDTAKVAQMIADRPNSPAIAELREIIEMDKQYSRSKRKR